MSTFRSEISFNRDFKEKKMKEEDPKREKQKNSEESEDKNQKKIGTYTIEHRQKKKD